MDIVICEPFEGGSLRALPPHQGQASVFVQIVSAETLSCELIVVGELDLSASLYKLGLLWFCSSCRLSVVPVCSSATSQAHLDNCAT
jgi:hypothetical protein